jgi:REP element-mobilizing transposase RayT
VWRWDRRSFFVACRNPAPNEEMSFSRRHLPHWIPENVPIFLTWRLAGTMPRPDPEGPTWLSDPRICAMIVQTLRFGEPKLYDLQAWVIMPNHIHLLLNPNVPLPTITCWLKGRTARKANRILCRTGKPFWQDECFDHWVRTEEERQCLIEYIETNPTKAGLVQWPWSSAQAKTDSFVLFETSAPPGALY